MGEEAAVASDGEFLALAFFINKLFHWLWGVFRKASGNYGMAPDREREMHSGLRPTTGPVIEFGQ